MADGTAESRRLEALEVKVAYQEATIAELSEALYGQELRLARQERAMAELTGKLKELVQEGLPQLPSQERPPHY